MQSRAGKASPMFAALRALAWLVAGVMYEHVRPTTVVLHGAPVVLLDDVDPEDLRRGYSVSAARSVVSS
jgi:hypothetical protein